VKTQIQSGRTDGSKSGLVQAKGYAQRRANIAGIVGCAHFDRPVDHSWSPDPLVHYSLNGPSWSLSDELFFYALFPWLLKWREPVLRAVFIAGMVLIVAGSCFTALTVAGYSPWVDWIFYVFPLTRLFEFIAGILLCRA
jgi:peptidoglycan/LPS O-acetylase OafA/YrhL